MPVLITVSEWVSVNNILWNTFSYKLYTTTSDFLVKTSLYLQPLDDLRKTFNQMLAFVSLCFFLKHFQISLSMAYSWNQRFPIESLKTSTPEIGNPKMKGVSALITAFPHFQEHRNPPNHHFTIVCLQRVCSYSWVSVNT